MNVNSNQRVKIVTLRYMRQFDLIMQKAERDDNPDPVIGPLIRDFAVVKYCIEGKGTLTINGAVFPVTAGQCYVVLPGDIVTEAADPEDPWRHVFALIHGTRAAMIFNSIGITNKVPFFPWKSNPQMLNKLLQYANYCRLGETDELKRIAYAYLFLNDLTNYQKENAHSPKANMESTYVNQALEYMEYNCNEKLTIADVAAHIGLTRSYFYTIFKAHTHMSPQQYLTKLRITKACELLSYPNSTVTSVANALGYDTSVFYRHFKEIIGYSPSEYKQRAAEGILFEQKDQYLDLQQLQKKKRRSPQAPSHPEE